MAKVRKGYDAQDRIIARFRRDAKASTNNSAVAKAMRNKKSLKKQKDEDEQDDFFVHVPRRCTRVLRCGRNCSRLCTHKRSSMHCKICTCIIMIHCVKRIFIYSRREYLFYNT